MFGSVMKQFLDYFLFQTHTADFSIHISILFYINEDFFLFRQQSEKTVSIMKHKMWGNGKELFFPSL